MYTFKEFIKEHYITTDKIDEKNKYHDKIHHMLKSAYKDIGGYGGLGHNTKREHSAISSDIKNPEHIVKIKKIKGEPVAVSLYRKQHGRKRIAVGSNQTEEGKGEALNIIKADNSHKRSWSEVSGKMEHLSKKIGVPSISNKRTDELLNKHILKKHDDDSYDRDIGGHVHTKKMMGHPYNVWK